MGTDISAWMEIRDDTKWHYVGEFIFPRNYEFFGIIADVRRAYKEQPEREDLPMLGEEVKDFDDASDEVKQKLDDMWWHDAVILNERVLMAAHEYMKYVYEERNEPEDFVKNTLKRIRDAIELLSKTTKITGAETRLFCVFDS